MLFHQCSCEELMRTRKEIAVSHWTNSQPRRLSLLVAQGMPPECCSGNSGFQSLLLPSVWTGCFSCQSQSLQRILWALLLQKYFQGIQFRVCLGEKNCTDFILGKWQKHQKAILKHYFLNVWLFLFKSEEKKNTSQTKAVSWIQRWTKFTRREY